VRRGQVRRVCSRPPASTRRGGWPTPTGARAGARAALWSSACCAAGTTAAYVGKLYATAAAVGSSRWRGQAAASRCGRSGSAMTATRTWPRTRPRSRAGSAWWPPRPPPPV
jgi:hypothetical protein